PPVEKLPADFNLPSADRLKTNTAFPLLSLVETYLTPASSECSITAAAFTLTAATLRLKTASAPKVTKPAILLFTVETPRDLASNICFFSARSYRNTSPVAAMSADCPENV